MTTITSFPTIRNVLYSGNNIGSFTPAGGTTISAGQIVVFHSTGVSMTVHTKEAASIQQPIGVALYDSSGTSASRIAVALTGCIVYCANDQQGAGTIDAGDYCLPSSAFAGAATGLPPGGLSLAISGCSGGASCLGLWLDDVAAGGTGRVLINPMVIPITVT